MFGKKPEPVTTVEDMVYDKVKKLPLIPNVPIPTGLVFFVDPSNDAPTVKACLCTYPHPTTLYGMGSIWQCPECQKYWEMRSNRFTDSGKVWTVMDSKNIVEAKEAGHLMTTSIQESLAGHDPREWAYMLLVRLNVPRSLSNMRVIYSWQFWESGGGGGKFNPLNTVQPWPGATDENSVGVKNYQTFEDGINATYTVLQNQPYVGIIAQLAKGNDAGALIKSITSSIWGTTKLELRDMPLPTKREKDMIIQNGRKSTVNLMTPYAVLAIDGQHVELWWGAKIVGCVPTANPNLFLWHPGQLDPANTLVAITRRVNDPKDLASGGEVRGGVVVADNTGRVHNGWWA